MSDAIEALRVSIGEILRYEEGRERSRRHMGEKLAGYLPIVHRWDSEAAAAGINESCPLRPLVERYAEAAGVPIPAAPAPEPGKPAKGKKTGRKKTQTKGKKLEPKAETKPAKETTPAPKDDPEKTESEKLLPKGDWLKSHAEIIEAEIPVVKSAAADPEEYAKAKKAFLERNLPRLGEYIEKPRQGHSPLFAYCALYLFDTGHLKDGLKLCEEAVRLRQKSPLKRNYHELQFDLKLMQLEADCERIAATGKQGKDFEAARAMRDGLMASPFRSNHAKAKVCKTFATLAHAVGNHAAAKENLLRIKFLDPNMGVETLLAKVETAIG